MNQPKQRHLQNCLDLGHADGIFNFIQIKNQQEQLVCTMHDELDDVGAEPKKKQIKKRFQRKLIQLVQSLLLLVCDELTTYKTMNFGLSRCFGRFRVPQSILYRMHVDCKIVNETMRECERMLGGELSLICAQDRRLFD